MLGTDEKPTKNDNFQNYMSMVKHKMNDKFNPISDKFTSLQNSISGKRLFSEIQRDIASWKVRLQKNNGPEVATHSELIYVDKTRALAVMGGGETDLINQVSKLEKKYLNSGNSQLSLCWSIHYKEGLLNYNKGAYDLALACFDEAIRKENEREEIFIIRSKTFLALNEPSKALQDCEMAIRINRSSYNLIANGEESSSKEAVSDLEKLDFQYIRALTGKAEALYAMREFEKALMFYYRSLFRRKNCPIILSGIRKTILSLENCLNDQNFKGFTDLNSIIQKVGYSRSIDDGISKFIFKFRSNHLTPIDEEEEETTDSLKKKKKRGGRRLIIKGRGKKSPPQKVNFQCARHLSKDLQFVKKLIELKIIHCSDEAGSALEFLTDRKAFWVTQGQHA